MRCLISFLIALSSLFATAQEKQKNTTKVVLLGSFHFDNPGLDVAKFKSADILSVKRQKEVEEVTGMLKKFAPTKIFIEAIPERQREIDSLLNAYKDGRKQLGGSEVQQLGFRLAKELNLPKLYPVDYQQADFPFDSLMKSATEAGQTNITSFVQTAIQQVQEEFNEALSKSTIRQMLLRENSPRLMNLQHEFYFKLLPAGRSGNHVGSYLVSEWWRRNMVIYENILKNLDGKEERILVIFGAGHTAILNELMKFNPAIQLVSASEVLAK
jgi:Family of unknown function (DUF5694)